VAGADGDRHNAPIAQPVFGNGPFVQLAIYNTPNGLRLLFERSH
jgi:hypothetical protein